MDTFSSPRFLAFGIKEPARVYSTRANASSPALQSLLDDQTIPLVRVVEHLRKRVGHEVLLLLSQATVQIEWHAIRAEQSLTDHRDEQARVVPQEGSVEEAYGERNEIMVRREGWKWSITDIAWRAYCG